MAARAKRTERVTAYLVLGRFRPEPEVNVPQQLARLGRRGLRKKRKQSKPPGPPSATPEGGANLKDNVTITAVESPRNIVVFHGQKLLDTPAM